MGGNRLFFFLPHEKKEFMLLPKSKRGSEFAAGKEVERSHD